jgi:Holliday junction DNA helicase RuvB
MKAAKPRQEDTRVTTAGYDESWDRDEGSLRPKRLEHFLGQDRVRENLGVSIAAARKRKECLDHVFFSGPPGLGKTTLAGIIANEMGVELRSTAAPALEKQGDLAAILTSVGEKNVFFIDEIHRLKPVVEEMLYAAMEDFQIDVVIGQGPGARSIKIPIPPFTLIGATTRPGLLSRPLYDRFGIHVRLDFYSQEDIERIILRSAGILAIAVEGPSVGHIAQCSRGTPRVANRILRRMRDFAQVWGTGTITDQIVTKGLASLEIDAKGLDKMDRRLLETVIRHYAGGPVGLETLAISLGESVDSLEEVYEPYLIQSGFLQRTPRGRLVTRLAYEHLGIETRTRPDQELGI